MKTVFSGKTFDSDTLTKEQAQFLVGNFENDALGPAKIASLKAVVSEAGGLVERYNGTSKLISFDKFTSLVGYGS